MRRLISLLAAGIMASLSIMAAIGEVHAQKKPRPGSGVIAAAGETATTAAGTTTALTAHNPANTLTATLQAFERYGVMGRRCMAILLIWSVLLGAVLGRFF